MGFPFDLDEGETLGLVGESGCGKSVTNLALMRLLPPAGRPHRRRKVIFNGEGPADLDESDMRDLRGKEIAMIFQDPMTSLNPVLTVQEQMVETIQAHRRVSKSEARARTLELLGMGRHPAAGSEAQELPASVQRWHAPAGDDRHGARAGAQAAHRRRATTALDVTIQAQVLELLSRLGGPSMARR